MKTITLVSLVIFSQLALAQKARVETKNKEVVKEQKNSVEKKTELLNKDGKARQEFLSKSLQNKLSQDYGLTMTQSESLVALAKKHPKLVQEKMTAVNLTLKSLAKESKEVSAAKKQLELIALATKSRDVNSLSTESVRSMLDVSGKMAKLEIYFPSLKSTVEQYKNALREGKTVEVALENAIDKDNGSYNLKELFACL